MTLEEFVERIRTALPVGSILENPGGGTSTIIAHSPSFITYRRGKSSIRVAHESLFKAYTAFLGRQLSSSDLKVFAPNVFDSAARPAGHSCNGTFLLLLLRHLGLAGDIQGKGVRGNPYWTRIS